MINETRACCLIANGSGYSLCAMLVRSVSPSKRLQEQRMLSASPAPLTAPLEAGSFLLGQMTGSCCPDQPVAVHAVSGLGLIFLY